jgi:DNA-binding GntR family transcriptional regulator
MPPASNRATESAAGRAYRATKELILSGEIPPGSLLSEGEIADRLTVSRTPVREAFLRLETEDLLHLVPKRGAIVVPVPPTEAADVLDVRFALETASVRRLCDPERDLTPLLGELEQLITAQEALAASGDVSAFAEVDQRFHRAIVDAAGNAIASKFYLTLADRQRRMTIGAVGRRTARLGVLLTEHKGLRDRVRDRDGDGFAAALSSHLDSTHNIFHAR